MEEHEYTIFKRKVRETRLWQVLTAVLVVLFVVAIFTGGLGLSPQKSKNADVVASETVSYINENLLTGATKATLESVTSVGDLYLLKLNINGQKVDSYVTRDGGMLFAQGVNLREELPVPEEQSQQNVPKSSKPNVELFVMSHCPYGTQIEKGIIPVLETLGNKIDFELKFVNYAMHGEKELKEQLNQYCIQKEFPKKFIPYLKCFLKAGDGTACLAESGIGSLKECTDDVEKEYKILELFNDPTKAQWKGVNKNYPPFNVYDIENKKYDIQGSPTLVINGVQVSSGRDSVSLFSTICSAFESEPSLCDTDLSSQGNPAPGFGTVTASGTTAPSDCGA